jgi:iron complex transport system substrate-binding protein
VKGNGISMAFRLRLLILLSILVLVVAACAPAASPSPSAAESVAVSPPAYPVSLTDDAGRSVDLPGLPQRIVSLAPSNTEIVCALRACDHLVGVTDFDDYPAEVSSVAKVVIGAQVDVEKVVDANPQLILAAGNELTPSSVITQLANLGYPVLVLYPESLDELYADIELVGRAIDASSQASGVVGGMRTRAQAVADAVASAEKPRTFYEVGVCHGTIYTAGADSFLASLISIAGGDPITGDRRSTAIQLEDLVAADPQLVLLGDAAYDPSITPESVAARAGWQGMAAVTDGRILVMLDDPVITRPGPRIIDGLEALARAIHPELFS